MITIHGVPISVHTRKAIVTAHLKGIDHKVDPVIPFDPPANWEALSPTGLIPVMQDGDFTLGDSTAICGYLDRQQPAPSILPNDPRQLGRTLWFDAYAGDTVFRNVIHGLFFQKIIRPAILKQPTDPAAIDAILTNAQPKIFAYLEAQAGGDFLVGASLTLADIAIVSNLVNYQYLGFAIDPGRYPRLARYARGVIGQDAFRQALANERPFAERMGLDRSFLA
jgi:glutathione S-transferase